MCGRECYSQAIHPKKSKIVEMFILMKVQMLLEQYWSCWNNIWDRE